VKPPRVVRRTQVATRANHATSEHRHVRRSNRLTGRRPGFCAAVSRCSWAAVGASYLVRLCWSVVTISRIALSRLRRVVLNLLSVTALCGES
jgi:hypothetical protein